MLYEDFGREIRHDGKALNRRCNDRSIEMGRSRYGVILLGLLAACFVSAARMNQAHADAAGLRNDPALSPCQYVTFPANTHGKVLRGTAPLTDFTDASDHIAYLCYKLHTKKGADGTSESA